MNNIICFENDIQAALFNYELSGQISDGYWENSRPNDHYRPWCAAIVKVDPVNVGINFYAQKRNYNFVAHDLLECVGDRMLDLCKYAIKFGFAALDRQNLDYYLSLENFEIRKSRIIANNPNDYWKKNCEATENFAKEHGYNSVAEMFADISKVNYTLKDMKKELNAMKICIKKNLPMDYK